MKAPYYYLNVSFFGWDEKKEDAIIKAVGRRFESGSGYGFGRRDVNFVFKSKKTADNAIVRVRALRKRVKCALDFVENE